MLTYLLLLSWLCYSSPPSVAASNIEPSNSTLDLGFNVSSSDTAYSTILFDDAGYTKGSLSTGHLLPMTEYTYNSPTLNLDVCGTISITCIPEIVSIGSSSVNLMGSYKSYVGFLSCDTEEYPGYITADSVLQSAINSGLLAVIMYSKYSDICTFTEAMNTSDIYIYTTPGLTTTTKIENELTNYPDNLGIVIGPETLVQNLTDEIDSSDGKTSNDHIVSTVAMIVLYSGTGVITFIFLVIVFLGSIRAHRNPERYGPRNIEGQPRQSRAKGLARAILETLPVVKFGDNVSKPEDVEMTVPREPTQNPEASTSTDATNTASANEAQKDNNLDTAHLSTSQPTAARSGEQTDKSTQDGNTEGDSIDGGKLSKDDSVLQPPAATSETDETHIAVSSEESTNNVIDNDAPGCSICTEDFHVGEDVRILPCNHRFHPACIDPWLLNVSATCPLCRIDLRPESQQGENGEHRDENPSNESATHVAFDHYSSETSLPLQQSRTTRASRRINSWIGHLNPHRMRHATREERIAVLREVRRSNDARSHEANAARNNASDSSESLSPSENTEVNHSHDIPPPYEPRNSINETNPSDPTATPANVAINSQNSVQSNHAHSSPPQHSNESHSTSSER